jgi:hypothetical protein
VRERKRGDREREILRLCLWFYLPRRDDGKEEGKADGGGREKRRMGRHEAFELLGTNI